MRSTVFIFGIAMMVLAITAALLPTQKNRDSIQSFKITYEKPSAPVADENLERPESPPPATQGWTQLLDTPKIEVVEEDVIVQKTKRQPTKTFADLRKETFSSLLEREGFSPVVEPQVLPNGLVVTVYDNAEEILEDTNVIFEKIGITMDASTAQSLQGSSLAEKTAILQDWLAVQSPMTYLPDDMVEHFDNADHAEKIVLLIEFFHGELSQDAITVLVDGYESLD
jgi:hypothetical protein